jgi:hypothetical protein
VIIHGVLARFGHAAIRTDKFTSLVADIGHRSSLSLGCLGLSSRSYNRHRIKS